MVSSRITEIQRGYFDIVHRHLGDRLAQLWHDFTSYLARNPDSYEPENWARRFFSTSLVTPVALGSGTTGFDSWINECVAKLATEVWNYWKDTRQNLQEQVSRTNAYYYFVPYFRLHEERFINAARVYFDSICLEDPIARLALLFQQRDRLLSRSDSDSSYLEWISAGQRIQIANAFWSLWWIFKYKDHCLKEATPFEFIVVPCDPETLLTQENPLSRQLALSYVSEIIGGEFQNEDDIVSYTDRHHIAWPNLVISDTRLSALFGPPQGLNEEDVVTTVKRILAQTGMPPVVVGSVPQLNGICGLGVYQWVRHKAALLVDTLWESSSFCADAAVSWEEWPFHSWMVTHLSKGIPPPPASNSAIGALAIHSDDLLFLGDLAENEIAFLRSHERLSEIRRLLAIEHEASRAHIALAPELARGASERFLQALATYKIELQGVLNSMSRSTVAKVVDKVKQEPKEIALTVGAGLMGLIIAPPWSLILTGVGMIVGGQSVRGILKAVRQEEDEAKRKFNVLSQSPLSVCLRASSQSSRSQNLRIL